jgi:hypothetical protein
MYSMQWAMDYLDEALHGTAIRYAAEKSNLADSIAELREIDGLAATMEDPDQHREERLSPRGAALGLSDYWAALMTGHSHRNRRQSTGLRGPVRVKSRFVSDVARETPTGRCSERDADTSNRPRSRSARRPWPRRNVPRRRRADTAPGSTDPSASDDQARDIVARVLWGLPENIAADIRLVGPWRSLSGPCNGPLRTSTCIVTRQPSPHITLRPPSAALADIRSQRTMPSACGGALPASSALRTEPASVPVSFRPPGCSPTTDLAPGSAVQRLSRAASRSVTGSAALGAHGRSRAHFPVRKRPQEQPRPV